MTEAMPSVVQVNNLHRLFGTKAVLQDVSLEISPGTVHGLVGENGAGKTTLLRHLLGLLKPQSGSIRIFGHDPAKEPVPVLSRVGYLSEDRDMPDWMYFRDLLEFTAPFYPNWDMEYAMKLTGDFGLDPLQKVSRYSRGQRAQAGLILAVSHHPELLILDEPSSGLDPIVRRDILREVIHTVTQKGHTVLFSSHILTEVEQVSDNVTLISQGKCLLTGRLDDLKSKYIMVEATFPIPPTALEYGHGLIKSKFNDTEWSLLFDQSEDFVQTAILQHGGEIQRISHPTLEDLFLMLVDRPRTIFTETVSN